MFHTAYMRATTVLIKINFVEFNFLNFLKTPNLFPASCNPYMVYLSQIQCVIFYSFVLYFLCLLHSDLTRIFK